jgi:urease accessory protein
VGAPAIHITTADFLIPLNLRRWPLAANGAGRVGGVRLALVADGDTTRLGACYQQVPLRVLPPFRFGSEQPVLLYLLNPTAGLMDGDGQLVELDAGPGTRTVVVGQSATRIHPSVVGLCTQQWRVRVGRGAALVVLPGPAIPFRGCRYYQRVEVDLADGAGLVWGDVWHAGRYARGAESELFQFALLQQDFTIRREGRLIFRDRFEWHGPWDQSTANWHFGSSMACGSVFVTGKVEETQLSFPSLDWSLTGTAAGDTCMRWRGTSEAVIAALAEAALQLAPRLAGQGGIWLSANELAPSHWFSVAKSLSGN